MSLVKKFAPLFILILLVYAWFFLFHSKPAVVNQKQVLGDNSNISLFVEPVSGRKPILDLINNAKKEILVEVYLLSDKEVISSLETAKSRGLAVNVMMEEHPFGGGNLNTSTKSELISKGVSVQWTNPTFALTHEKAIVADNSQAFILSQNLTASSFTKNREYDILDSDPIDVTEIRNIFLSDWNRQSFSPTNTDLLISPVTSRGAITNLITNATKEVDIEIEDIEDPSIISLFNSKSKTVKINLLIPTYKQLQGNKSAIDALSKNIEVRTISSPYMHAKLILVDNSKAYTGSVNLSTQSMDENRELGIIYSQEDAVQELNKTFETDWNNATPL